MANVYVQFGDSTEKEIIAFLRVNSPNHHI